MKLLPSTRTTTLRNFLKGCGMALPSYTNKELQVPMVLVTWGPVMVVFPRFWADGWFQEE